MLIQPRFKIENYFISRLKLSYPYTNGQNYKKKQSNLFMISTSIHDKNAIPGKLHNSLI